MTAFRAARIAGDIAYIPLTQGLEAVIDAEDLPMVTGKNWRAARDGLQVYALTDVRDSSGKKTCISMHRLILRSPAGLGVDHRDGDGLNNRRKNLRPATKAQNGQNRPQNKNNTSGFKGVSWHAQRGRWRAQIMVAGRKKSLGLFDTPEDAHVAYCRASAKFHGAFSNFGRPTS
jgi:hypothetical protein